MTKLAFAFLVLALSVACAKTYYVTFYQHSVISGTELKAGDYQLKLDGDQLTVKNGKIVAQAAVKVEQNGEKYARTTVRYQNGDGKYHVQEIRLGNTNVKLVFN